MASRIKCMVKIYQQIVWVSNVKSDLAATIIVSHNHNNGNDTLSVHLTNESD